MAIKNTARDEPGPSPYKKGESPLGSLYIIILISALLPLFVLFICVCLVCIFSLIDAPSLKREGANEDQHLNRAWLFVLFVCLIKRTHNTQRLYYSGYHNSTPIHSSTMAITMTDNIKYLSMALIISIYVGFWLFWLDAVKMQRVVAHCKFLALQLHYRGRYNIVTRRNDIVNQLIMWF